MDCIGLPTHNRSFRIRRPRDTILTDAVLLLLRNFVNYNTNASELFYAAHMPFYSSLGRFEPIGGLDMRMLTLVII